MKKCIYIMALLLMAGCKSERPASTGRYVRQPIVEVSQESLDIDAKLVTAKMQQELGNLEEAAQMYGSILEKAPDYGAANYGMAEIMTATGRPGEALGYAKAALKSDGKNVWYLKKAAEIYEKLQDGKNLTATWEEIVKLYPSTLENYYELSNAYLKANDVPMAVNALNRVEKMVGVTEMVSWQKHRLWEAYGKHDKALKELEALAEAMPNESKYNAMLAESHMQQKQYAKAKVYYDRILENTPDDEYIHLSLASYYKAVGDPQKAYEELDKGFDNPQMPAASKLQILGQFYTNEEFYGSASKYTFRLMDKVMGQCEDKSEYALFYGDVLMRQEKYKEAAEQFETALKKDSSAYEVWEALLICLSEAKEEAKTKEYAKRAQALFPLHVLPYYLQGYACFEEKRYAEAAELLKQCEKVGFRKGYLEPECYGLLAECLYQMGEREKAWGYFDKYLALRPNDTWVMNNYAYYLALSDTNLEKAEQMAKKAVEAMPDNASNLDTYAWILHKMGRSKEAMGYIQKAVKLDPKSNTLQEHLKEIKAAL